MIGLIPVYDVMARRYSYLTMAEFRALLGTPTSTLAYVGGPTGAIVVDNTKSPPEIDIDTSMVPRKAQSETITGKWIFAQGYL